MITSEQRESLHKLLDDMIDNGASTGMYQNMIDYNNWTFKLFKLTLTYEETNFQRYDY